MTDGPHERHLKKLREKAASTDLQFKERILNGDYEPGNVFSDGGNRLYLLADGVVC